MKRIVATIVIAALVVVASAVSGLIPSVGLLKGVWAGDEGQTVSLGQVPPPVKATIERESSGGQVTGISKATEGDGAAYAVRIAKDGQTTTMYVKSDGTVLNRVEADDDD